MSLQVKAPDWFDHVPLVLSELDEKQRRWVAGLLSEALGHGGTRQVAKLSGLDPKTIRQGRIDLNNQLADYPKARVRRAGAGRPPAKKTMPNSNND